jgi:hypothetical protein
MQKLRRYFPPFKKKNLADLSHSINYAHHHLKDKHIQSVVIASFALASESGFTADNIPAVPARKEKTIKRRH